MAGAQGLPERLLRHDRTILIAAIATIFALAATYTVLGVGMKMSALDMTAMGDMPGMAAPGPWTIARAVLVFLMWWVMMIAMMLPSVAPTVLLYSALLRASNRPARVSLIAGAFLSGYLAIWAVFSLIALGAQRSLEALGYLSATMTLTGTTVGALVLIAAGLFQFTPLKESCLRHCRSPAEFITRRRRPGTMGGFAMGLEHGTYCLGCCWFLMALLFVGGIMNLYWIVGIAAYVAVEKLTPLGEPISRLCGVILVSWGGLVLIGAL